MYYPRMSSANTIFGPDTNGQWAMGKGQWAMGNGQGAMYNTRFGSS
ncbi:MAG: hypothetical protein KME30_26040 [Iphinoe sp. HA4291-MV1]|nr:hypothetical protein [Iphinoe sp. HA4291-MV1]